METTNFVMFSLNYPHNFIKMVWDGAIADHLLQKFVSCYNEAGSYGAMIKFYSQLSEDNRILLNKYIAYYYGSTNNN